MFEKLKLFEDQPVQDQTDLKPFKILQYIGVGRTAAVSMRYLATIQHTDMRTVRSQILAARLAGHVIIGDDFGYYLPSCEEELTAWINRQKAALKSKSKSMTGALQAQSQGRYPRTE